MIRKLILIHRLNLLVHLRFQVLRQRIYEIRTTVGLLQPPTQIRYNDPFFHKTTGDP